MALRRYTVFTLYNLSREICLMLRMLLQIDTVFEISFVLRQCYSEQRLWISLTSHFFAATQSYHRHF